MLDVHSQESFDTDCRPQVNAGTEYKGPDAAFLIASTYRHLRQCSEVDADTKCSTHQILVL